MDTLPVDRQIDQNAAKENEDAVRLRDLTAGVGKPAVSETVRHEPGAPLEVFEHGRWVPCIILRKAEYAGKSGPGYYAAYDPPRESCGSFWCHNGVLRARAAIAKATP